jgi:hypothetical protein
MKDSRLVDRKSSLPDRRSPRSSSLAAATRVGKTEGCNQGANLKNTYEPSEVRPSHPPKNRGLESHEFQQVYG